MVKSSKVNQVILLVIDDIRASHMFQFIREGKMPHFQELINNGISSENCITSYPAITFPCYSNIVLGTYSGYYPKEGSGIPMYHWVARGDPPTKGDEYPIYRQYNGMQTFEVSNDIGPNAKTIFEQAGEGNFFSSLNIVDRGSYFYPHSMVTTVLGYIWYAFIRRNFSAADYRVLEMVEKVYRKPQQFFDTKEVPKVTVAYIPGTDELLHHKGFDHPDYINEVIRCDTYMGKLMDTLKQLGYYDSTAIGIITDHGNYKAEQMYNLEPFFEQKGLVQYNPEDGSGDFDTSFGCEGFFNFPGDSWHTHPTQDQMAHFQPSGTGKKELNLFETLWQVPGVKLMYYRDDDNSPDKGVIHLERKSEEGKVLKSLIEYEGHGKKQRTRYLLEDGDVYHYSEDEKASTLLDGNFHTIDEWLHATAHIDYPMIPDQLPRYFKNPRSCDIIVSTLGEYGFGFEHGRTKGTYPYSHDIPLRSSMVVPFIIGGSPEIPNKTIKFCKTTDIVPTLLDLLGIAPHHSVVGTSLL